MKHQYYEQRNTCYTGSKAPQTRRMKRRDNQWLLFVKSSIYDASTCLQKKKRLTPRGRKISASDFALSSRKSAEGISIHQRARGATAIWKVAQRESKGGGENEQQWRRNRQDNGGINIACLSIVEDDDELRTASASDSVGAIQYLCLKRMSGIAYVEKKKEGISTLYALWYRQNEKSGRKA